ncbi:MAG: T9SS type A sorting domain-containing protein [bacterium]
MYAFKKGVLSEVTEKSSFDIPIVFALQQNYPNPFNPSTTIKYQLPRAAQVSLQIYNANGQLIETLFEGVRPAGYYAQTWQPKELSSGVYFYRLKTANYVETKRLMLLK